MSGRRRTKLERNVKAEIEAEIGAEPDLLLLRNTVGQVKYYDGDGNERRVTYGLGVGSPDLVGILTVPPRAGGLGGVGVWFCLEIKAEEGDPSETQAETIPVWIRFGALVYVVKSAREARSALEHARRVLR